MNERVIIARDVINLWRGVAPSSVTAASATSIEAPVLPRGNPSLNVELYIQLIP